MPWKAVQNEPLPPLAGVWLAGMLYVLGCRVLLLYDIPYPTAVFTDTVLPVCVDVPAADLAWCGSVVCICDIWRAAVAGAEGEQLEVKEVELHQVGKPITIMQLHT